MFSALTTRRAALRSIVAASAFSTAIGRPRAQDAGGGEFDGEPVSRPGVIGSERRELHRKLGDRATPVTDYPNVVGDATTDCTPGLQKALTSGYDLWFPPGSGLFRLRGGLSCDLARVKLFSDVPQRTPNLKRLDDERGRVCGLIADRGVSSFVHFLSEGNRVDNLLFIGSGSQRGQTAVKVRKDYRSGFRGTAAADFESSGVRVTQCEVGFEIWGFGVRIAAVRTGRVGVAVKMEFPDAGGFRQEAGAGQRFENAFRHWMISDAHFHATVTAVTNVGANAAALNGLQISNAALDTGGQIFRGVLKNGIIDNVSITLLDDNEERGVRSGLSLASGSSDYVVSNFTCLGYADRAQRRRAKHAIEINGDQRRGKFSNLNLGYLSDSAIELSADGYKSIVLDNVSVVDPCDGEPDAAPAVCNVVQTSGGAATIVAGGLMVDMPKRPSRAAVFGSVGTGAITLHERGAIVFDEGANIMTTGRVDVRSRAVP